MDTSSLSQKIQESYPVGREIGFSPWIKVDQAMITKIGESTLDPDPMHINTEWAKDNSPYGETIAFGFLTSSLLTNMLHGALGTTNAGDVSEFGYFMNYGMDYLRFLAPVPVNSRIRGQFSILESRVDKKGRNVLKYACQVVIENEEQPAMVAEWLAILMPHK